MFPGEVAGVMGLCVPRKKSHPPPVLDGTQPPPLAQRLFVPEGRENSLEGGGGLEGGAGALPSPTNPDEVA